VCPLKRKTETGSFPSSGNGGEVRYSYNRKDDVLRLRISDKPIVQTVETEFGLVDVDAENSIVQIVIYAATKVLEEAEQKATRPNLEEDLRRSVSEYVGEARGQVPIP
jgi:uncharacterized protein DUF2283